MEQQGILSRMMQRLRFARGHDGRGNAPPATVIDDSESASEGGDGAAAMVPSTMVRAGRKERTELTLEKLQEGYHKVVDLVGSIQEHLDTQEQRTRQLVDAMSQLASNLSDLPQATAKQTEALNAVAESVRESAARDERLGKELIGAQRQTGDRVAGALGGLNQSVASLGEASQASTSALRKMHDDAADRDERLAVLFAEQTKRFTIVFSFAITLAVIAAVTGVIALLR